MPKREPTLVSRDELRTVRPEEAASMLGWSTRTLERRSADGTGPRIIKISPRNRRLTLGEIHRFLRESSETGETA
jgi:predicted DNA-binding transcriptional regulator AlpA